MTAQLATRRILDSIHSHQKYGWFRGNTLVLMNKLDTTLIHGWMTDSLWPSTSSPTSTQPFTLCGVSAIRL